MNAITGPCEICRVETAESFPGLGDIAHYRCPRCGEFKVISSAMSYVRRSLTNRDRAALSGWVYDHSNKGSIAEITSTNFDAIISRQIPTVRERAIRMLLEAGKGVEILTVSFNPTESRFYAATYSHAAGDLRKLAVVLREMGLIEGSNIDGTVSITTNGFIELDELRTKISESSNGFVAMWFNDQLDDAYTKGFQAAIINAGYDDVRIDKVEHINKIDDEIIASIKSSKFLVADFTGHRGGVYFEAGYALGLGLPVIWTCRKDDLSELHFDIRQFNCIDWETPEDLSERLFNRLNAVIGLGPKKKH